MNNRENTRVLIAEDAHLVSEMIKILLEELGYTVVGEAADGVEAVEMAHVLQPDVILMDIEMPNMNGIEATRQIQAQCPTPVVMLTAHESDRLVVEVSDAGAGAYLVKPPRAGEMKRAITIALARFDDMMALQESNRRLEETLVELQAAQDQLVKQERLAAVGQLAAGIAHEFNNLLTAIILPAQVGLRKPHLLPSDLTQTLESIINGSKQAAHLVKQIQDFGRRSMMDTKPIDLVSLVEETTADLQQAFPENVHLLLEMGTRKHIVDADLTMMRQVLMNLAANARDAMPDGGELRIKLERIEIEPGGSPPLPEMKEAVPNRGWVCLAVSDTGVGMTKDVRAHLFEPFFTTRLPLRTGLGLAQAHGIVKQHKGYIGVETEEGKGSTFCIYLPVYVESVQEKVETESLAASLRGDGETILLVEDNAVLLMVGQDVLQMLGYHTLAAANGQEALKVYQAEGGADLVITDLMMPNMGGRELAQELKKANPDVRVLAITGYTVWEVVEELKGAGFCGVIYKPFDVDQLAQAVRRALDE
ncbi:MAG: hypothetical protein DRI81_14665 [Chloroflexi bacterium]|nr:MAG: hypothetical protein DRI81_14665 [Chloroflexota bacterium]HEY72074.1 response regulator [Thermoflexia bacterium]